jgi:NADH-quinone oxidoreductase subunit E
MLSVQEKREIDQQIEIYGKKRAISVEALKIVQRSKGWISDESLGEIAAYLDMTTAELDSVATCFNMIHRKPVGRHVILVCDSVSCWIMGYGEILQKLQQLLGVKLGETTVDHRFTLLPVACLGVCDKSPAMMIDEDLHVQLTPQKIGDILNQYP